MISWHLVLLIRYISDSSPFIIRISIWTLYWSTPIKTWRGEVLSYQLYKLLFISFLFWFFFTIWGFFLEYLLNSRFIRSRLFWCSCIPLYLNLAEILLWGAALLQRNVDRIVLLVSLFPIWTPFIISLWYFVVLPSVSAYVPLPLSDS